MSTSAPSHAYQGIEKTEMYSLPERPPARKSSMPAPREVALSADNMSRPVRYEST